jgi:hypothetical protein
MHEGASSGGEWTDLLVQTDFFEHAEAMRSEFEAAVGPQRSAAARRFAWDYWHVPGQYGYIRTFARNFFSPALYRAYVLALTAWASERLGCAAYTEPWLSYYVDGCRQEFHTDVVNGPWAWVFSLTRWGEHGFTGGETTLLGPKLLDYWRHFKAGRSLEARDLFRPIAPVFNQLTVFDARIPHGVPVVEGTRDPLEGRVVLHGWFMSPQLRVVGGLAVRHAESECARITEGWSRLLRDRGELDGVLVIRFHVDADGSVHNAHVVAATLLSLDGSEGTAEGLSGRAVDLARAARFPAATGAATVTLPLIASSR